MQEEKNIAFIDGQNLHLWIKADNWKLDVKRFRIYLKSKYKADEVYYFLWTLDEENQELYNRLQKAWFIIIFRKHLNSMISKKKWNVDVDIVFEIMKKLIEENNNFDKIILVSWDWDYYKLVKYLIKKRKFKKVLFPNKKYSSLYKNIKTKYRNNLSLIDNRKKIEYKKIR